ncbi:thiamine phosphate synthase [Lachnoclostridium sp. Marseille-P6806]|uniref:thiamine phosphate synthase n=1 Tax=Lachnoclostridium sp. Marseille-P6806 TaxID=2364793 RepID=UPI0010317E61|nr:thiamine phosphate synthase [Lachnoclostridium sp. Marseille-P6806]
MALQREALRLYAVTDRRWLGGRTLVGAVEEALLGGVTMVQLREKLLAGEALRQEAEALQTVCRRYGVPFLINDDAELCATLGADGVHVGQEDMSVGSARALLGPERIVGATAHNVEEALRAEAQGADYLGCGAAFGSRVKTDARPITLSEYAEITAAVKIPVVAIGGIDAENISRLRGSGLAGAAVISGIFATKDIRGAAKRLRAEAEKL